MAGHVPYARRLAVFARDGYTCRGCRISYTPAEVEAQIEHARANGGARLGPRVLTIDHVVPLSQGGTSGTANLQTLCGECNGNKGNTVPHGARVERQTKAARKAAKATVPDWEVVCGRVVRRASRKGGLRAVLEHVDPATRDALARRF